MTEATTLVMPFEEETHREKRLIHEFSLLLVQEFCKQHQLTRAVVAIQSDLEHMGISQPTTQVWMEMYERCRPAFKMQKSDESTMECIVNFILHIHDFYYERITNQPISIVVSPSPIKKAKKSSFLLKDAFHATQNPLRRPSQRPKDVTDESSYNTKPENQTEPAQPPIKAISKHKSFIKESYSNELPKLQLQVDLTDSRHRMTTLKSVERGIRDVYSENRFKELQDKMIARVLPGALSSPYLETDTYVKELEKERFGTTKRKECSLCHVSFLMINLPARVSFRCIMELYDQWQYIPPDKDGAKYRPPRCYDEVQICRFCDQLVQQLTWDMTFDEPPKEKKHTAISHHRSTPNLNTFCSDPFALPPIPVDDCLSTGRLSVISDVDIHEEKTAWLEDVTQTRNSSSSSASKMLVYKDASLNPDKLMSSKEWSVIAPVKGSMREALERSILRSRNS
ncbi:hypothetical protein THRCLA_22854 [Thraustotheca clavata]|uniref:Uncharacterized protein n=1 Tax=Thraustotheca clavata TaxID=74557 RepID=A0A1V9YRU0_9STRA|nr:hypothetical protein THRCLA_22854 [Thraustotheca clavata]